MESLFYVEQRFNPFVAKKYGVNEAVFIQKIIELQLYNAASGLNSRGGRYWVKSTRTGITKVFIFWTERQIQHLTEKLKDKGLLHIENFNPDKTDRTLWYSLSDDSLQMYNLQGGQFETFAKYGLNMNPAIKQPCKMDLTNVLNGKDQTLTGKNNSQSTETDHLTNVLNGDKSVKSQIADIQDLTNLLTLYNNKDININNIIKEEKNNIRKESTKEKKNPDQKPEKPKREPGKPKREPELTELHNQAKEAFLTFYTQKTGEEYYWTAGDAGSLEQLIKKQKNRLEAKGKSFDNTELVLALTGFFNAVPDWYIEKLSMKILNSSYNSIISEIVKQPKIKQADGRATGDKLGINVANIEH